jgi:hypothetical protein
MGSIRIETDELEWRVLHFSMEDGEFREVPVEELLR